ncbi:MAG: hypothetical protein N2255_06485, partial [Kiritimatiellae bacterium]|nr:hypothetical protein [Kiritimatiellia bacterium]
MTSYYTRAIVLTVLYVLALTLAYGPAYASFVQLHISPAAEYRSGRLIFHVLITNAGSECARSPRIEVRLAEHTLSRDLGTDLAAGFSTRITLETDQPPIPPGTHTAIVMVCYDDANGYPYTALAPVPVVTAEPPTALPLVDLRLLDSEFHEKGCISARLRTTSSVPLNVRVKLFLPEELRLREEPVSAVQVVPGRESRLTFAIENRWAMPVSRYIVVATADYLADGRHASAVATSRVIVRGPRFIPVIPPRWGICLSVFCFIVCAAMRFSKREISGPGAARQDVGDWAVVTALVIFLLYHFPLRDLVSETLTVGGDTPAHHYLASHLRERLRHGKGIISWAGGWWCGFPMFQFYFCLPYLVIALLGFAIPHSIAFKLVSVLGILGLPPAAYVAGRIMRLPRPMPLLSAMATIPLLFDSSHTMWGVNIFSTLAGMIANSLSFPLMLLAIASMVRDCSDGFLRIRTVLLLAAMLASHFFTSVIAALTLVALPVAEPNAGLKKTILIPLAEGILALSLMAWWLVPLVAKREYAVDFGENWNISLLGTFPRFVLWLLPLACVSLAALFHRGTVPPVRRQIVLSCWMLVVSTALFLAGSKFSSVFVNVRLWPFIWHSLLCLSAMGMGILLMRHTQGRAFALTGILILTLSHGAQNSARVYAWARWNYSGLERKPRWPVWEKLVLPLKGTTGRLANDLHEENNSLGSTRIFESV